MTHGTGRKLTALAFCLLFAVACTGESGQPLAPTSPSTTTVSPSPASEGATVSGTVNSGGGFAPMLAATTSRITVTVVGAGLSAETDSAGRFVLRGVPTGDVRLRFTSPSLNAEILISGVQRLERIDIVVMANGPTATLQSSSRRGPDGKVEIEGLISAVNASERTVQVGSNLVHVPTVAVIRHGSQMFQFSDMRVGDRVHIRGIPGTSMTEAQEIELQNPAGPGPVGNEVELKGMVQGKSGTCPNLTFTVNGTAVMTNGLTQFKDGPCSAIANGTQVEVEGTLQNGTLVAREVEIRAAQAQVELKGMVQNLSGTCPNLSFTVNGTTAMTNGLTRFRDGPCSAIANGTQVEVEGTLQNGTLVAREVEIRAAQAQVELKGTVQNPPSGTCPNLTFTVNGTTVMTNGLTQFKDGLCAAITSGTRVEIKGVLQTGKVLASRVEIKKD